MALLFHITLLIIYLCKHLSTLSQPSAVSSRAIDRGCLRTYFVKPPELYQLDLLCSYNKELLLVEHRRTQSCAKMHWLNTSCLSFGAVSLTAGDLPCSCFSYTVSGRIHGQGKICHPLDPWLLKLLFQCHLSYVLYPTIPSCVLVQHESCCLCELVCAFLIGKFQRWRGKDFSHCGPV